MQTKSRTSLLLSNMLIYGLNQVLVVLIPMIMLPVYSRFLPDISVYGVSSLTTTICTLVSNVAIFGMFDASVRFSFDNEKKEYKTSVTTTATMFIIFSSVVAFVVIVLLRKYIGLAFFGQKGYEELVIIAAAMAVFTALNTSALIPIRIYNMRKQAVINSLLKAVLTALVTIILLIRKEYLLAIPVGTLIALFGTWIITFLCVQRKHLCIKLFDKKMLKDMLKYAAPLMITFVSYWIYQSADKMMLSNISDLKEVGIYTIGAKIGAVAGVIQNAFASGWAYFAFSTMNDDDQISMISRIFKILLLICSCCSFLVLSLIYYVFQVFFAKGDYTLGAPICAALFLAPLFLTLMQVLGTQLLIKRNTKFYSGIQLVGACVYVLFNFMFIPQFGARGAAVATLIGYAVPLVIMIIYLIQRKLFVPSLKTIMLFTWTTLAIGVSTLYVYDNKYNLILGLMSLLIIIIGFRNEIKDCINIIKNILCKKVGKK